MMWMAVSWLRNGASTEQRHLCAECYRASGERTCGRTRRRAGPRLAGEDVLAVGSDHRRQHPFTWHAFERVGAPVIEGKI